MTPEQFKEIRANLGLSQQAMADRLKVHRVTVARWETGKRAIPNTVAYLLSLMMQGA